MSVVYMISDLHLGHRNIANFRKSVYKYRFGYSDLVVLSSMEEHEEALFHAWNETVKKRDTVYVLGDIAFDNEALERFSKLPGHKRVILGNHDVDGKAFCRHVDSVSGATRYRRHWLTHIPIHPDELRGGYNIHGHVHDQTIPDSRYFNVCPEYIGLSPIKFDTIKEILHDRNR